MPRTGKKPKLKAWRATVEIAVERPSPEATEAGRRAWDALVDLAKARYASNAEEAVDLTE